MAISSSAVLQRPPGSLFGPDISGPSISLAATNPARLLDGFFELEPCRFKFALGDQSPRQIEPQQVIIWILGYKRLEVAAAILI